MRRLSFAIASLLALGAATPLSAATVLTHTFAFTGSTSVNGTAGNSITQMFSDGLGHSVTAKVTAWSISTTNAVGSSSGNKCAIGASTFNSASCISKSYLGDYGNGLGVTGSGDSNGANNLHTIDNVGQQDFIIIQFDRKVKLISATFTPFSVDGSTDSDATIGVRNLASQTDLGPNAAINLTTRNSLNALLGTQYGSNSTSTSANNRLLDPNNYIGRIWMIAASLQVTNQRYYDNKKDGFKLKDVKVVTVGVVPEPATWLTMIAGFGFAGAAIRRRKALLALRTA